MLDQKNRDEILDHDGHIFVLAGAGTGKSTIIAQKILRLLKNDKIKSVREIAAITYTNKAAAELKWKIEENIKKEITSTANPALLNKYKTALSEINDASIGTIHSFCAEILRKHGYTLAIDPAFSIMSKNDAKFLLNETFQNYVREKIELSANDKISGLWQNIFKYSRKSDFSFIPDLFMSQEDIFHFLKNLSDEVFFIKSEEELNEAINNIFQSYSQKFLACLDFYDYETEMKKKPESLGGRLFKFKELIQANSNTSDLIERFEFYADDLLPGRYGSKSFIKSHCPHENLLAILKTCMKLLISFGGKPFKDLGKDLIGLKDSGCFQIDHFNNHYGLTAECCTSEYLRYLWFQAVKDFAAFYEQQKMNKSLMSYSDLINYCLDLIKIDNIRDELNQSYLYIFVDEYQDTDPVQTEIFTILSGIYNVNHKHLQRLIRVGDAKQSIYSFRGADLDTFYREKDRFSKVSGGLTGELSVNMRSHSEIIQFINRLFSNGEIPAEMDIPGYEALSAGRLNFNMENPGVYTGFFIDEDDSKKSMFDLRQQEAQWIINEISDLKRKNPEVSICIFFRTLTDNIQPYVAALKANGIPFSLVGRRFYGENFTQKYLTLFLNILYDPFDYISLTGYLRSPIAGFNDMEVEEIILPRAIGYNKAFFLNPENISPGLIYEIQPVIDLLNHCLDLANNQSLSLMLKFLFDNSGFLAFTSMLKNSDVIFESIDRIYELACDTDKMKFPSFLKKLRFFIDEVSKLESIPEVDDPGESYNSSQTVQIMSYHKSKGLEFDVVFLPDLMHKLNNKSNEVISGQSPEGIYWNFKGDFSFNNNIEMSTTEKLEKKKIDELVRLVYVAMTRAKQRLYLAIHMPESGKSILTFLYPALEKKIHFELKKSQNNEWEKIAYNDKHNHYFFKKIEYFPLLQKEIKKPDEILKPASVQESFPHTPYFTFTSPTSIMKSLKKMETGYSYDSQRETPVDNDDLFANPDISITKDILSDPVSRGVITHSLFEIIDLKNPLLDNNKFHAICFAYSLDENSRQAVRDYLEETLETYKKSSLYDLAKNAVFTGKEIPYSDMYNNSDEHKNIIVGYIDLLLKVDGQIYLVDYKTNRKPDNRTIEEFSLYLKESYLVPMSLYQRVISIEFPQMIINTSLYHTDSGSVFAYKTQECDDCLKDLTLAI